MLRRIPPRIEEWPGVAAFRGTVEDVMHQRVPYRGLHVRVLREVPLPVEQRIWIESHASAVTNVVQSKSRSALSSSRI